MSLNLINLGLNTTSLVPAQRWPRSRTQFLGHNVFFNISVYKPLGPDSIWRWHLTGIGNPIVEIRRSYDRLISTMGFPIPVRRHLYIESGPRIFVKCLFSVYGVGTCSTIVLLTAYDIEDVGWRWFRYRLSWPQVFTMKKNNKHIFDTQNGIPLRKRFLQRKMEPLKNPHHIFYYVSVRSNFVVIITKNQERLHNYLPCYQMCKLMALVNITS